MRQPPFFAANRPAIRSFKWVLMYLALFMTGGCVSASTPPVTNAAAMFFDDGDRPSLVQAIEHQLSYLRTLPREVEVTIQGDLYSIGRLTESLRFFLDIINTHPPPDQLDRILHDHFTIYQAGGRAGSPAGEMLITGYYQPVFAGSVVKTPPFLFPLFKKPGTLIIRNGSQSGKASIGRLDSSGRIVAFWTRAEIEDQNLLAGDELVYLQDPVDAFFLQIQGSGLVRLPDGSLRAVHISATNGREYRSIGKLLVDERKIAKEDISMQSIRLYLREHPDEIRRILHHNSKFVFFQWDSEEPKGSLGEVLTPGRSIAIDRQALPMGAIGYLVSQRPVIDVAGTVTDWKPLRRFVLPQDTGEAIKGPGRADVFWGSGLYAETAAGLMKEKGSLYFLVKKQQDSR
jgi:membrane-bound lytic murein transglycosylase A